MNEQKQVEADNKFFAELMILKDCNVKNRFRDSDGKWWRRTARNPMKLRKGRRLQAVGVTVARIEGDVYRVMPVKEPAKKKRRRKAAKV